jgi:hypothetical protein
MAGVRSIIVKESLDELRKTSESIVKERLQLLHWLKQDKAESIPVRASFRIYNSNEN